MPPTMPMRQSRERAERVFLLRAVLGLSWRAIADSEGFTSVGGAQRAYQRHSARNAPPDKQTVAAEIVERKRFTMGKAATALLKTDDPHLVAELVRAITSQDAELARLYGLGSGTVNVNHTVSLDDYQDRLLAAIANAEVVDDPKALER